MIFVRDKGRMANNILQYGHVYAWGRENKRKTMSMRFAYKYKYFKISKTKYHNFIIYIFAKYAAKWKLLPIISFTSNTDNTKELETMMLINQNIIVEGWYARWYNYFLKYKQEIIENFAFNNSIEHKVQKLMGDSNSLKLGVHIRRGDYKKFRGGQFFYSDEQYVNVIKQFISLKSNHNIDIYICGNDPHLDRQFYYKQLHKYNIVFPNGNPGEDLCLLSHCDYLIGPPSTFSLVAAMYRDLPLYWIMRPDMKLSYNSFKKFDYLFRNII